MQTVWWDNCKKKQIFVYRKKRRKYYEINAMAERTKDWELVE